MSVSSADGGPAAGFKVIFEPGSPAPDNASRQTVITDDAGRAELTLPSGCYRIELDRKYRPDLVSQVAQRRCFKPVGIRHLVTLTARLAQRPPPSRCTVRPGSEYDHWFLTIYQDSGQWAPRYRALDESGHRLTTQGYTPVKSSETSRTYRFSRNYNVFRQDENIRVVAAHASGNSSAVACSQG